MAIVRIPSPLRELANGRREVQVRVGRLRDVLEQMEGECPGIGARLRDARGHLLPYVNLYLDGNDVRLVGDLDAEVGADSVIEIVPAVSGGSVSLQAPDAPRRPTIPADSRKRAVSTVTALLTLLATTSCADFAGVAPRAPATPTVLARSTPTPAGPGGLAPYRTTPPPVSSASASASESPIPMATTSTPESTTIPSPVTPRSPAPSVAATPAPDLPPPVRAALADARAQAQPGQTVSLVSATLVEWPDASLGCPKPGLMYAQVITPGYRVEISSGGATVIYHTDTGSRVELCNRN